jgi:hypothetical protein
VAAPAYAGTLLGLLQKALTEYEGKFGPIASR